MDMGRAALVEGEQSWDREREKRERRERERERE
jgi:hypothetical protein